MMGEPIEQRYIAQRDTELLGLLKEAGIEVTTPDPAAFREAAKPAYEAFYKRFGDDARQFVEAIDKL